MSKELALNEIGETVEVALNDNGVTLEVEKAIKKKFAPLIKEFEKLHSKTEGIMITKVDQKKEMALCKANRLLKGKVRKAAGEEKDLLKKATTAYNKEVMFNYNLLKEKIEKSEAEDKAKEEFAKLAKEKELAELRKTRTDSISEEVMEFIPTFKDIEKYTDEEWENAVKGAKAQVELGEIKKKEVVREVAPMFERKEKVTGGLVDSIKTDKPTTLSDIKPGEVISIGGVIMLKSNYTNPAGIQECYVFGTGELYEYEGDASTVVVDRTIQVKSW